MQTSKQCKQRCNPVAICLVLAFAISICLPAFAAPAEEALGLRLSVDFNKTSYVLGEPVIVSLSISNIGKEPVTDRWFAFTRGVFLDLENSADRRMEMCELESPLAKDITNLVYTLQPGETVTTAFDLTRGDIIASSPFFPRLARVLISRGQRIPGYVVEPGTYRLIVTHCLEMNKSEDGLVKRMKSSKQFTVLAPSEEERKALTLFEANPSFEGEGADISQTNALADYDSVWEQYRSTPFAAYALYYSARILQKRGEYGDALAKYDLLRKEFPQFPLNADVLYYQAAALTDAGKQPDAKAVASMLASQFSNHVVSPDVVTPQGSRIQTLLGSISSK